MVSCENVLQHRQWRLQLCEYHPDGMYEGLHREKNVILSNHILAVSCGEYPSAFVTIDFNDS